MIYENVGMTMNFNIGYIYLISLNEWITSVYICMRWKQIFILYTQNDKKNQF